MKLIKQVALFTLLSGGIFLSSPLSNQQPTLNQSNYKGWFVGIRGAYVRSAILEIGYDFNKTFKLRLIGLTGKYHRTAFADNQRYSNIHFKPQKVGAMVDWNPWINGTWVNGFRLTMGIAYNRDRIDLNSSISGALNGFPASAYGSFSAKYRYRRWMAPYFGLGYDTGSLGNSGISLSADAGFWIQGKVNPRINFTGTGQNNPTVVTTLLTHAAHLINKSRLNQYPPMVSVGIRYLF